MYPQMYIPAIKNVAPVHDVNAAAGISPVQEVTSYPTTLFPSESTSVPTSAHVASPRTVPFAHQHMDPQIEYLSLRTCILGYPFFLLTRSLFSSANEKQRRPQGDAHLAEHFQHFHTTTPLHTPVPLNPLESLYIPHRRHDNTSSHFLTPLHPPADVSNTIPPSIPGHDPFTSLVPHTARDPSLLPARFEYTGSPQFVTTPGSASNTATSAALGKGYGPHFGMYDQIPIHNGALQETTFLIPDQTTLTRQIKPDAVHAPVPSSANSRIGFPAGIQPHNSLTRQWTLTHGTILSAESDHLFFPASSISDTGGAQVYYLWTCLQVPSRWLEHPQWASPH